MMTFIVVGIIFVAIAFWLLAGGWDWIEENIFIETVYVDATYEDFVIDRPSTSVHLTINGNGNDVEVTEETSLRDLNLNGNENSVKLCEGVHDPEINNEGVENEIIFDSC